MRRWFADDLRTIERLARAANEPSPKFLVTMKIDRPNDTDAMAAFNRWKDLVLACTPERILSMVEEARKREAQAKRYQKFMRDVRRAMESSDDYRPLIAALQRASNEFTDDAIAAARAVPSSLEERGEQEQ